MSLLRAFKAGMSISVRRCNFTQTRAFSSLPQPWSDTKDTHVESKPAVNSAKGWEEQTEAALSRDRWPDFYLERLDMDRLSRCKAFENAPSLAEVAALRRKAGLPEWPSKASSRTGASGSERAENSAGSKFRHSAHGSKEAWMLDTSFIINLVMPHPVNQTEATKIKLCLEAYDKLQDEGATFFLPETCFSESVRILRDQSKGRECTWNLGHGYDRQLLEMWKGHKFHLVGLMEDDVARVLELYDMYSPGYNMGVVDCCLVTIAERMGVGNLGTLDYRHFHGLVQPRHIGGFNVMPKLDFAQGL